MNIAEIVLVISLAASATELIVSRILERRAQRELRAEIVSQQRQEMPRIDHPGIYPVSITKPVILHGGDASRLVLTTSQPHVVHHHSPSPDLSDYLLTDPDERR